MKGFKPRSEIENEAERRFAAARQPGSAWKNPAPPLVSFYDTAAWLELRYRALKLHGGHCQCCGNGPAPGNPMQVDHIKPRSRFPELELDLNNLQVLCKSCNTGKGAWDQTDWRRG